MSSSDTSSITSSIVSATSSLVSASLSSSTTSSAPAESTTSDRSDDGDDNGGPTSSPLLFFVALGFGVVFTNLWIIVGVKYCFRYNQRNRALRAAADGEPIDLTNMARPHRRRREKKLMTMDEVNERFPTLKYKTWRANREMQGLPTEGGINPDAAEAVAHSRAPSVKDVDAAIQPRKSADVRRSADSARPRSSGVHASDNRPGLSTIMSSVGEAPTQTASAPDAANVNSGQKEKTDSREKPSGGQDPLRQASVDEDDDDPIRAATGDAFAEQPPGDTCAICLDSLDEDDDVRGLTCGHAFHAACVDPWLTSRRACCPLCKADYYVPKPRPEGENDAHNNNNRRGGGPVGYGWLGSRYMPSRPRMVLLSGSRGVVGLPRSNDNGRRSRSSGQQGLRHNPVSFFGSHTRASPNPDTQQQQSPTPGWRTRLHGFRSQQRPNTSTLLPSIPNFFRRGGNGNSSSNADANPSASPSQLEAGNAGPNANNTTTTTTT